MSGLPDFDTLKQLAQTQPETLETLYQQEFHAILARRCAKGQRKLKGLQFKIDAQKQVAKNPMDRLLRIFNMMNDSFHDLNDALAAFRLGEEWQISEGSRNEGKAPVVSITQRPYQ